MDKAALILVIIGALNWLSVGILGFDAVAFLFGRRTGRGIEAASGIWTIAMYVFVGMVPHLCGWGAR